MYVLALLALIATAFAAPTDPCVSANCPASTLSPSGENQLVCNCTFTATSVVDNATSYSVVREYGFNGLSDATVFLWTIVQVPATINSSSLNVTYTSAAGSSVSIASFDTKTSVPITVTAKSDEAKNLNGQFSFDLTVFNGTVLANQDLYFAVGTSSCMLPVTLTGMTVSWNPTAFQADLYSFKVYNYGTTTTADGTVGANTFVPTQKCAQGQFSLFSELKPANNLPCKVASDSPVFWLTNVPTAPGGLAITNIATESVTTPVNGTALVLNLHWAPANGYACTDTNITYYASISTGGSTIYTWTLKKTDVSNNGTYVEPLGGKLTYAQATWDSNALYTFTLWASTPVGNSAQVTSNFVLPGPTTDPCASCPASTTTTGEGTHVCSCVFNATSTSVPLTRYSVVRQYGFDGLSNATVFLWAIVQAPITNSSSLAVTYTSAAGSSLPIYSFNTGASVPKTVKAVSDEAQKLNGQFSFDLAVFSGTVLENQDLYFSVGTQSCVLPVTVAGPTVSWNPNAVQASLYNFTVYNYGTTTTADGTVGANTFVPTQKCAQGQFSLVSELIPANNLPCKVASDSPVFWLTNVPTAPGGLAITNIATENVTTPVNGSAPLFNGTALVLNVHWTPSDGSACSNITYYASISTGDSTIHSWTLDKTAVFANGSYVEPLGGNLTYLQATWDPYAIYTFTLWANTPAGNSDKVTSTFFLPGGSTTTTTTTAAPSSDSSSGLSNTVIAGIAVGATVGVVALALIIYKCSTSRRAGYQNIGADSNA